MRRKIMAMAVIFGSNALPVESQPRNERSSAFCTSSRLISIFPMFGFGYPVLSFGTASFQRSNYVLLSKGDPVLFSFPFFLLMKKYQSDLFSHQGPRNILSLSLFLVAAG